ncbi:MAG: amidohydrolase family protein [Frankia sp.]|nr:amidohydrolase family protein [Frankia sp.]
MVDLVIRGGTVVDGTGAPARRADVAVAGGRVVAVAERLGSAVVAEAATVLDASGHVVAPGFIDIHTHYDAQVFWDPRLTPSCYHGVTTVIAGNCGFSIAPTRPRHRELIARTLESVEDMDVEALRAGIPWDFATFGEYLASVGSRGLALNFGAYIGHTPLRLYVMGEDGYERAATADEIDEMCAVLTDAMAAGAMGIATSILPLHHGADGRPVPSRLASREELEALLAAQGRTGRGVAALTLGDLDATEIYDMQLRAGIPFTYSALLTRPDGSHRRLLEINEAGWARGARVWPQVTPRPLRFTVPMTNPYPFNVWEPFAALAGQPLEARLAAYADPDWRREALARGRTDGFALRWETYLVAESQRFPELVDRRISDLAAERGVTPLDALLDLAVVEPELRVACIVANDDQAEVAALLTQERVAYGLSDAGAHVGQLCDAPQATDLLGIWVRERGVVGLEQAVHGLTGRQADILGLPDRGRLLPGHHADIVVFDPETIAPGPIRRVADFPAGSSRLTADQPTGIRHVLVNGTPIHRDGVHLDDARPGTLVRPAAHSSATG